jgi:tetratricopeptide (TPR) repeat protein
MIGINNGFIKAGTWLLMTLIVALSVWMNSSARKLSLYTKTGMVFLLFFVGTAGFAVQYLAWLIPWIAELGILPVGLFVLTGSVFLLVVYNFWNLGMPWYLAIAYPWLHLQYFQVLCWLSVLLLAFVAWRRARREADFAIAFLPSRSPRVRLGVGVLATSALLFYPAVVKMRSDTFPSTPTYMEDVVLATQSNEYHNLAAELFRRGRQVEANSAESRANYLETEAWNLYSAQLRTQPSRANFRTPEDLLEASLADYNSEAFSECVADATASLKFRPGVPAAWNNISICNAMLGKFDVAITAAREALRCDPGYWPAQQNLDWAISQKRQQ